LVRLAALFAALMAGGAEASCRLALVLALDVSSSVDAGEYDQQRLGLASALNAPDVRHAILQGGDGHVAIAVYEWSGMRQQTLHMDWTPLRTPRDIDSVVAAFAQMERGYTDFPTALGYGLSYGATLMARAPDCTRRVINVSGDGVNNHGYGPELVRKHFPLQGVTVNGLVIEGDAPGIAAYYHQNVISGPGAFVESAGGFDGFEAAMARKLFREINDIMLGSRAAPARPRG